MSYLTIHIENHTRAWMVEGKRQGKEKKINERNNNMSVQ